MRPPDLALYGFFAFAIILALVAICKPQWLIP